MSVTEDDHTFVERMRTILPLVMRPTPDIDRLIALAWRPAQGSADPAEIWLQPKPYSCDGRLWSEEPHEGEEGTRYIRADLVTERLSCR